LLPISSLKVYRMAYSQNKIFLAFTAQEPYNANFPERHHSGLSQAETTQRLANHGFHEIPNRMTGNPGFPPTFSADPRRALYQPTDFIPLMAASLEIAPTPHCRPCLWHITAPAP
jgi:hypothetical protein